jgi:hypothetical protein
MSMNILLRISAGALAIILLFFAALQINDPDPVLWTGYYLACAVLPTLVIFQRFSYPLFWGCVAVSFGVVCLYIPGTLEYLRHAAEEPLMQSMNPEKPYIEETRELIGGAITLAILFLTLLLFHKLRPRT